MLARFAAEHGLGTSQWEHDRLAAALLPVVEAHTRAARADELEQLLPRLDDLSLPGDYSTFGQGWNGALNTLHGEIGSRAALRTHEGDTP